MWVRKQEAEAEWQELATLRPRLCSKCRSSASQRIPSPAMALSSHTRPLPQQPPQSQAASPPTTTQSISSFVEVLGSSYCSSCRGKLCGVTSSCSQCKRGVQEHCFVTGGGGGTGGVLRVPVEVVKSLWVTLIPNNASNANAMCMLNVHFMVHVSSVLNPYARVALPLPKLGHSTLHGNRGAPG